MKLTFEPKAPKKPKVTRKDKDGGNYKIIANDFLEKVVKEMCLRSLAHFKAYSRFDSRHPLRRQERMMYGMLAGAIGSQTKVVISEAPARRHLKKTKGYERDGTSGRVDLLCYYRKKHIYLELKRVAYRSRLDPSKKLKQDIMSRWRSLERQSDALTKHLRRTSKSNPVRAIRIGLLIVPWLFKGKGKVEGRKFHQHVREALLAKGKQGWRVWSWSWLPPKGLRKFEGETNPAVGFFAIVRGDRLGIA